MFSTGLLPNLGCIYMSIDDDKFCPICSYVIEQSPYNRCSGCGWKDDEIDDLAYEGNLEDEDNYSVPLRYVDDYDDIEFDADIKYTIPIEENPNLIFECDDQGYKKRYLPSLIDKDDYPLDYVDECTEILSLAFYDNNKDYFVDRHRLESNLDNNKKDIDQLNTKIKILLVIGIITFIIGVGIILLIIAYVFFRKIKRLEEMNKNFEIDIGNLYPKGIIDYASKLFLPLYVFPFSNNKSLVFDSMGMGNALDISYVNINDKEVANCNRKFHNELNWILDKTGNPIVSKDEMYKEKPHITTSEYPGIDLYNSLLDLEECYSSRKWRSEKVSATIHGPHSPIGSNLSYFLDIPGDSYRNLNIIRPYKSIMDCENDLKKLKRIREITIDEDLSSEMIDSEQKLNYALKPLIENYLDSISLLKNHVSNYLYKTEPLFYHQFCPECIEIKELEPLEERYNLGHYIMEKFRASIDAMDGGEKCLKCGKIINIACSSDEDCLHCGSLVSTVRAHPRSAQAKAEMMIEENIRADLDNIPMQPILKLEHLQIDGDAWKCRNHGLIKDARNFIQFNEVFSYTVKNLWDEMEKPVRKKADKANTIVTQNRQKYNDQMLSLLPFDQLMQDMEIERKRLEYIISGDERLIYEGGDY